MSDEEGENRGNTHTIACMHVVKNDNAIRGCRPGRPFSCHRTKGWQECIQGCRAGSFSQRGAKWSSGPGWPAHFWRAVGVAEVAAVKSPSGATLKGPGRKSTSRIT